MNRNQTVTAIVGMLVGLAAGAGLVQAKINHDHEQYADTKCWVQGGTYVDGTCIRIPGTKYDKFKDEGQVCTAMNGSYMVEDESFQCFNNKGEELKMPDLTGKEVIIMGDGTLILRGKR